jgi:S1-C subfamily serine protease
VGVLCNPNGKVRALWINYSSQNDKGKDISFMSGLASEHVIPLLEQLRRGEKPRLRAITDVEFWTMRIAAARTLGLNDEWVRRIESSEQHRYTLLYVLNILATDSPAAKLLRVGDVVLELNGKVVTRMRDLYTDYSLEAVDMVSICYDKSGKYS